jgi:hypothetical protein
MTEEQYNLHYEEICRGIKQYAQILHDATVVYCFQNNYWIDAFEPGAECRLVTTTQDTDFHDLLSGIFEDIRVRIADTEADAELMQALPLIKEIVAQPTFPDFETLSQMAARVTTQDDYFSVVRDATLLLCSTNPAYLVFRDKAAYLKQEDCPDVYNPTPLSDLTMDFSRILYRIFSQIDDETYEYEREEQEAGVKKYIHTHAKPLLIKERARKLLADIEHQHGKLEDDDIRLSPGIKI